MKPKPTDVLARQIESISSRYDPENDIAQFAPRVTATDAQLLAIIEDLAARVSQLELEIQSLKEG